MSLSVLGVDTTSAGDRRRLDRVLTGAAFRQAIGRRREVGSSCLSPTGPSLATTGRLNRLIRVPGGDSGPRIRMDGDAIRSHLTQYSSLTRRIGFENLGAEQQPATRDLGIVHFIAGEQLDGPRTYFERTANPLMVDDHRSHHNALKNLRVHT